MKICFLTIGFTLLNTFYKWLPSIDLSVCVLFAISLDFITGVIKSVVLKVNRTSEGYRKTIIKFLQYGSAIAISILLSFLSEKKLLSDKVQIIFIYFGDTLLSFIIFIEITSILENIYAVDKKTPFSRYFIQPLLKILTFQIKNKLQEEDESSTKK